MIPAYKSFQDTFRCRGCGERCRFTLGCKSCGRCPDCCKCKKANESDGDFADWPGHFCVACGLCRVAGCVQHAGCQCDTALGKIVQKDHGSGIDQLLTERSMRILRGTPS